MGRLGFFLLGAVAGVVGTAVGVWLHDEYSSGGSSSSDSDDDDAETLISRRDELDEQLEDIMARRSELDAEIEAIREQRGEVEQGLSGFFRAGTAEEQSASDESSSVEGPANPAASPA